MAGGLGYLCVKNRLSCYDYHEETKYQAFERKVSLFQITLSLNCFMKLSRASEQAPTSSR